MPFGLQPTHLIIIAVVALIIFGPSRLPEIGRSLGKTLREFSSATKEASQSFADEVREPSQPPAAAPAPAAPAPAPAAAAPAAQMVACKSCGQQIPAGKKFCPECGAQQ